MGRTSVRPRRGAGSSTSDSNQEICFGTWWDQFTVRLIFAVAWLAAGYHFQSFGLPAWVDALIGLIFALSVFLFEVRLQRASLRRLIGAAVGSILGILGSYLMGLVLLRTSIPEGSRSFL